MTYYPYRSLDPSAILRLRVTPDEPEAPDAIPTHARPRGSKRPHADATVAAVRRLIEQTTLTHREITAKTGVANGTISKWTRDFGWQRHPFAPRASDTVPTARAGRRLKLRMLGTKLHVLAERCVTDLWNSPTVDLERLMQAMQVLKMARLEYMGNRRPRRTLDPVPRTGAYWIDRDAAIQKALWQMRCGGVKIDRIPDEAMALLEEAHTPPEREHPALRPRGRGAGHRRWATRQAAMRAQISYIEPDIIHAMKPVSFIGNSLDAVRAFPDGARREGGFQIDRLQRGLDPDDWKPMTLIGATIGVGVMEIRVRDATGAFRVIYIATLADAVYVLHAFAKKTPAPSKRDLDLATIRFRELMQRNRR